MKNILNKAILKQLELLSLDTWKEELIHHAQPILWFGNILSKKNRVLTIAANPSRWEVLHKGGLPRARVRVLKSDEFPNDILRNEVLAEEILQSYNDYFTYDPYSWFGKQNEPHKVEGFLRGMHASYYELQDYEQVALHADLFPFPTMQDYSKIATFAVRDLFKSSWARDVLFEIIDEVNPARIVVFGRRNVEALYQYILESRKNYLKERFRSSLGNLGYYSYDTITTNERSYQCCYISTNLGNPRPFTKEELREYGHHVHTNA